MLILIFCSHLLREAAWKNGHMVETATLLRRFNLAVDKFLTENSVDS